MEYETEDLDSAGKRMVLETFSTQSQIHISFCPVQKHGFPFFLEPYSVSTDCNFPKMCYYISRLILNEHCLLCAYTHFTNSLGVSFLAGMLATKHIVRMIHLLLITTCS